MTTGATRAVGNIAFPICVGCHIAGDGRHVCVGNTPRECVCAVAPTCHGHRHPALIAPGVGTPWAHLTRGAFTP